jgi:hypothetical protein
MILLTSKEIYFPIFRGGVRYRFTRVEVSQVWMLFAK